MRDRLKLLAVLGIYWIAFLVLIRALFMVYNHDYTSQLTLSEILQSFLYGLRMDLSITGYFLMFTGVILIVSIFYAGKPLVITFKAVGIALLFVTCAVAVVDVELYRHWGFRLNTTPFFYMGKGAMGSVDTAVAVKLISLLVVLFVIALYVFLKVTKKYLRHLRPLRWSALLVLVPITAAMIVPIRGSFTVAPMNSGFVYFHKTKTFANHAAINVLWNFMYSARKGSHIVYPEDFFDPALTQKYFQEFYPKTDSTISLLRNPRPNVFLIILESYTADVIEPLGGVKEISPNLNALCREGVLFKNFYSTGDRTDKGIIGVLSAYPTQPQTSIIKFPAKSQHLPFLPQRIRELGYHTSFIYGGDIDFANFRSYLTNCGFDHITDMEDFPDEWNTSKWGIHDHYVFNRAFEEIDSATQPFFKVMLSLSSHEPFDVPMEIFYPGDDNEARFLNACHYTDKSLGEFINRAKQSAWWNNTLVVITADHGARHPGHKELKDARRFHIPLLLLGGALNVSDTVIATYGNQTDIANTLLGQLDKPREEFLFSQNLLSTSALPYSFYFFTDGFGYVAPGKYIIYDNAGRQFYKTDGASPEDLDRCKAYEQMLYTDYNKR